MLRNVALVVLVLASVCLYPRVAQADAATALTRCPGYRAAVEQARGALSRGDRTEAVAALERAKAALQRCNREEAQRTSLLG